MKGLGDFQRAQMRDIDPRVGEFFGHLRRALDALEQIMLRPHRPAKDLQHEVPVEKRAPAPPSVQPADPRLAFTVKEVRKLVGISNATLYKVIGRRELRVVKMGGRTLIMAKDLREWLDGLPERQ
jgi:excisionase family DNA binding protein